MLAEEGTLLLGADFLPWMVLAFGAALVVGNALALLRPPDSAEPSASDVATPSRPRPPMGRTIVMIVIGGVASAWGVATLLS